MSNPNQPLIDAFNLIAKYINTNLPSRWQIEMIFGRGWCQLDLIDPDGDSIDVPEEPGASIVAASCLTAEELDADYVEEELALTDRF